jgi:adenylate cyclase
VPEARQAMAALNEKNSESGLAPLNMASRLETLTKQLGRTVLLSRAFADFVEIDFDLERVGEYPVRGFNPIEMFAYHG